MTYSRGSSNPAKLTAMGDEFINNTGSQITKGTVLAVDATTGEADLIDVSSSHSADSIFGVAYATVDNGSTGTFVSMGLLPNIEVSFGFGDEVFVSKSGGLTNVPPEAGQNGFIEGDSVIYVGIIKKNKSNPLALDLYVNMDIRGAL